MRSALAARATGAKTRVGSSQPREGPARMFYTKRSRRRAHTSSSRRLSVDLGAGGAAARLPGAAISRRSRNRGLGSDQHSRSSAGSHWPSSTPARVGARSAGRRNHSRVVARHLSQRGMSVVINHGPGEEALGEVSRAGQRRRCRQLEMFGGRTDRTHPPRQPLRRRRHRPHAPGSGFARSRGGVVRADLAATQWSLTARGPWCCAVRESVHNTTHTDRPDEGLVSIEPQAVIAAADQLLGEVPWLRPRIAADWGDVARRIRVPLGFVFAAFYFWRARPTWQSLVAGACIVVAGNSHSRGRLRQVKKDRELTMHRPLRLRAQSALSRLHHPGGGIRGGGARPVGGSRHRAAVSCSIYVPVIRAEEIFLRSQFPEFAEYKQRVPALLPRTLLVRQIGNGFSRELYFRHREYNALLGAAAMLAALVAKILWLPG